MHVQDAGEQLEGLRSAVADQPGIADGYRRRLLASLDAASEMYATGDLRLPARTRRRRVRT